jgi:group I intron endonuclease
MIGIYKITSPSGRIYIGQSVNIEQRWEYYKKIKCGQQRKIYNSLKKHGPENHIFEIIEECSEERLNERELYWGNYFNSLSKNNLNLRLGNSKGKLSTETKLQIGKSNKGKARSEKTKQLISEKQKGNKNALGTSFTQESKNKISQAKIGHVCYNKERNNKISNSNKGKIRTDIHKQNYSKAHKGKNKFQPKMNILKQSDIKDKSNTMSISMLSTHYGISIPVIRRFLKNNTQW